MTATIDGVEVYLQSLPGFSYSFYNFIDPSKVKGNNSTTIEVTPTNEARAVLGGPSLAERKDGRHTLRIGTAGATYWIGEVRVDSWSDEVIRLVALGGNASWMDAAKALTLRGVKLGVSEVITKELQRASWTDETTTLHFPLIDYGRLEDRPNSFNVPVGDLRPALRVWPLITRAFQQIGNTIRAEGRFARLSTKLVMPGTDEVFASAFTRDQATAVVEIPAPLTLNVPGPLGNATLTPSTWTEISDPSSAFAGQTYTSPFFMALRPVIDIDATLTGNLGSLRAEVVTGAGALPSSVFLTPTEVAPGLRTYQIQGFAVPVIEAPLSGQYIFRLRVVNSPSTVLTVNSLTVRWVPDIIYYQSGITIDQETAAPKDMTLAELVTGLGSVLNLKFLTDDQTGEIVVRHFDDILKPITQGLDWRGREQHDPPAVKVAPDAPSRYLFRYEKDERDEDLRNVNELYPAPGWGNADVEMGGTAKEVTVETAFAPTNMGPILEDLFGPIMRNIDAPFQTNKLDYQPRILIADGVVDGSWTHAGDALTEYPKTYFVWPGEFRYALSFDNNGWYGTTARGTVSQYFSEQLRRIRESYVLRIRLRLYDDELLNLDLTRPVYLSDGYSDGWYYILKINQKQFGTDGFTECDLMQL